MPDKVNRRDFLSGTALAIAAGLTPLAQKEKNMIFLVLIIIFNLLVLFMRLLSLILHFLME